MRNRPMPWMASAALLAVTTARCSSSHGSSGGSQEDASSTEDSGAPPSGPFSWTAATASTLTASASSARGVLLGAGTNLFVAELVAGGTLVASSDDGQTWPPLSITEDGGALPGVPTADEGFGLAETGELWLSFPQGQSFAYTPDGSTWSTVAPSCSIAGGQGTLWATSSTVYAFYVQGTRVAGCNSGDRGQTWQVDSGLSAANPQSGPMPNGPPLAFSSDTDTYWLDGSGQGLLVHYDGTTLTRVGTAPQGVQVTASTTIFGSSGQDLYVPSSGAAIAHSTDGGSTWASEPTDVPAGGTIVAGFGTSSGDMWALASSGSGQAILGRGADGRWTTQGQAPPGTTWIPQGGSSAGRQIWMPSASTVVILASQGGAGSAVVGTILMGSR